MSNFEIWVYDGEDWLESSYNYDGVFFEKFQDAVNACHSEPSDYREYMFGIQQDGKWVAFVFEGQVGWIMDKETVY